MEHSEANGDAALLQAARAGEARARAELKARHTGVARRLALTYVSGRVTADAIVDGAFEQLFAPNDRGTSGNESFRAYLFVKVRRAAASLARQHREDVPQGLIDLTIDAPDVAPPGNTRALVSSAFDHLSERHQVVLWHATVEGAGPTELGGRLGMSTDGAAALAYRAREQLRSAYLDAHLAAHPQPDCAPHVARLDAYVRRSLRHRDRIETAAHVEQCAACRALIDELADVSVLLLRATVPLLLGFSLLTGLPPVEAPPFRSLGARGPGRVRLATRSGATSRSRALTVVSVAALLLVLAGTAFAISSHRPHTASLTSSRLPTSTVRRSSTGATSSSTSTRHRPRRVSGAHVSSTTIRRRSRASTTTVAPHHHGSGGPTTTSAPTGPTTRPTTTVTATTKPGSTTTVTAAPTTTTTEPPTTEPPTTTPDTTPPDSP